MTLQAKATGAWHKACSFIKASGQWYDVRYVYQKVSGTWRRVEQWGFRLAQASDDSNDASISVSRPTKGLVFKPDGSMIFTCSEGDIRSYDLTVPWDVTTATNEKVSGLDFDTTTDQIVLKPDGTRIYGIARGDEVGRSHTLSTPWDVTTASFDSPNYAPQVVSEIPASTNPSFAYASPDGLNAFITDYGTQRVYRITTATPWDFRVGSYSGDNLNTGAFDTWPKAFWMRPDGLKAWVAGPASDTVHELELSTAWTLSTASATGVTFFMNSGVAYVGPGSGTGLQVITATPGGEKLYGLSTGGFDVPQPDFVVKQYSFF